ncbi:MAG TPA: hypothetical protein VFE33_26370 [Thermoanaerobaculia bacterium]|nr:hypothetical protein [Thermoanaerobaculia bacterium]
MKRFATFLALLALVLSTPCLAQSTTPTTTVATAPTAGVAAFLATLPGPVAPALPPAPEFLSTTCTSNADCPMGQLCCYPCGIDGCSKVCMAPFHGHCPFFP